MLTFNQYLQEKVINVGFNPEHDKFREQYRNQIHDILRRSYSSVEDGYGGMGHGTPEESSAIHNDITNSNMKLTKRGDTITSVNLYKDKFGRKSIATGHDGTPQGKKDWRMIATDDIKQTHRNVWGELSGASEHVKKKLGSPEIPVSKMGEITGKDIKPTGEGNRYTRIIGGKTHEKVGVGNPKI